ncbi:MAG TPA: PEP-CTERM system histidine kinase PrsK, partial [Rhodanobacteraceae bacterium]|nr:PEP-CTERM system histidine kinase PrsK [Rhodanobacteraceae bacterium]
MHVIIFASYIAAAAVFLAVTGVLVAGWRGQRTGALLVIATTTSMLWGVLLAWAEWQHALPIYWLLSGEVLRYGAWLTFLGALLGGFSMSGALRGARIGTHALWIALALYCLLPAIGPLPFLPLPFSAAFAMGGVLVLALVGVVFL